MKIPDMNASNWIERIKRPGYPEVISYAAAGLYIFSSLTPIAGFPEIAFLAGIYFLYLRFTIHRDCSDDRIRAEYLALWIGYLLFFLYALIAMPFIWLLPEKVQANALSFLTMVPLDLLYIAIATLYLVVLDRRASQSECCNEKS